ncbi:DUF418 domain-containing protein [Sphingomonas sp. 28-62-11]|uniref:DUF418 domain-containing protein n=1 Tax=Sphingomonas sp. 28-62-11 TaxID=1970432 RepID=UPI000BC3FD1E|nr:MAG: hypothetical protein B7Y49_00945 [Sphingomonas sp. 28-62-11]
MSSVNLTGVAEPDGAPVVAPVRTPRVAVVDILRGIAIIGILFMNINDMGQSLYASSDDIRHLGWRPWDQAAWWLREVLANGTARCLLEMLFGVGMVILTDRFATEASEWAVLRRYYVRNIVLFLFGVIHMYILLWPGDILHSYGLAALVAVFARSWRPHWLLTLGLSLAFFQLLGGGYFGYYQSVVRKAEIAAIEQRVQAGQKISPADRKLLKKSAENKAERAKDNAESTAQIAAEDKGRSGDTWSWVNTQIVVSRDRFPAFMEIFVMWEAAGTMLIGAALFKLGIIQGGRSRHFYRTMTLIAYGIAIPLRTIGAWEQTRFGEGPYLIWFTSEIARLLMTLGHVGLVHLIISSVAGHRLLRPFEAAGKTALSVYIAQTLITLWVLFPPFGFHLYGQLTWAPLMLSAVAINVILLVLANLYMRYLDIGPVEWAWRSLIEWRALPWRRR